MVGKARTVWKRRIMKAGLASITAATLVTTLYLALGYDHFLAMAGTYLSSDGKIKDPAFGVFQIYKTYFVIGVFLILLGSSGDREVRSRRSAPALSMVTAVAYALIAALVAYDFFIHGRYTGYAEDGLLEYATAVLALLAAFGFLYLAAATRAWKERLIFVALFAVTFFFGMEEISWGQRIIGWQTPEMMVTVNDQRESNLHNIVNELLPFIYTTVFLAMSCTFFFAGRLSKWVEERGRWRLLSSFLPSGELFYFGYVFVMFSVVYFQGREIPEAVFALTAFVYSIDMGLRRSGWRRPGAVAWHGPSRQL